MEEVHSETLTSASQRATQGGAVARSPLVWRCLYCAPTLLGPLCKCRRGKGGVAQGWNNRIGTSIGGDLGFTPSVGVRPPFETLL